MAGAGKWADLAPRVLSGAVLLLLGGAALWIGGIWLRLLLIAAGGVMMWELIRMSWPRPGLGHDRPWQALAAGGGMALILTLVTMLGWTWALILPPLMALALAGRAGGEAFYRAAPAYAAAIGLSAHVLILLRELQGGAAIGWLIGVVVISDIAGYLAGRALGGPKFWPRISPKKTWSGTVAGWIGAALLGALLAAQGVTGWLIVPASALVALAGQMGDIAESALKRQAGVKDSSALIPGHGGFLDRFDAVIGAALAVLALSMLGLLPGFGG